MKDGGPAFPQYFNASEDELEGLTLRDYFAGQALAGMSGAPEFSEFKSSTLATLAYVQADAMLKERDGS